MRIVPITLREANTFVAEKHRHHPPSQGCKFAVGLKGEKLHGVAIAGRPIARLLDDGLTLEVTRLCTDGTDNACSRLYRAVARIAKEMGYKRIVTYTLPTEGGSSLKGAGFRLVGEAGGGSWSRLHRPRNDTAPIETKWRWDLTLNE